MCICGSWSISYQSIDASPEVGLAVKVPGTIDFVCTLNNIFKQLSSTRYFGTKGGGKGVPSSWIKKLSVNGTGI